MNLNMLYRLMNQQSSRIIGADDGQKGEGGMVVSENGAVVFEVEDAVVAEGCGKVLGADYKGREQRCGVFWVLCGVVHRTVPFGEGGSPLGGIGGGAPESWRSANSYLTILASKVNDLLDFSVSDA